MYYRCHHEHEQNLVDSCGRWIIKKYLRMDVDVNFYFMSEIYNALLCFQFSCVIQPIVIYGYFNHSFKHINVHVDCEIEIGKDHDG